MAAEALKYVAAIDEFADKYRPMLEAELEPGEGLLGICAANHRHSAALAGFFESLEA